MGLFSLSRVSRELFIVQRDLHFSGGNLPWETLLKYGLYQASWARHRRQGRRGPVLSCQPTCHGPCRPLLAAKCPPIRHPAAAAEFPTFLSTLSTLWLKTKEKNERKRTKEKERSRRFAKNGRMATTAPPPQSDGEKENAPENGNGPHHVGGSTEGTAPTEIVARSRNQPWVASATRLYLREKLSHGHASQSPRRKREPESGDTKQKRARQEATCTRCALPSIRASPFRLVCSCRMMQQR
jgi:hypothetical protein